jgi:hypothetical protein
VGVHLGLDEVDGFVGVAGGEGSAFAVGVVEDVGGGADREEERDEKSGAPAGVAEAVEERGEAAGEGRDAAEDEEDGEDAGFDVLPITVAGDEPELEADDQEEGGDDAARGGAQQGGGVGRRGRIGHGWVEFSRGV